MLYLEDFTSNPFALKTLRAQSGYPLP